MCIMFKENQNVSWLVMVAIDIYFIDKPTVSTSNTHNESSMASGEQIIKNIRVTTGASEEINIISNVY